MQLRKGARRRSASPARAASPARTSPAPASGSKVRRPNGTAAPRAASSPEDYASLSAFRIAYQRFGWLLLFLGGLVACAKVMSSFETLLAREIELAFFVPLLIGHGGNSGGQSVSTIIRALGSGRLKLSDAPATVIKEASAGAMQAMGLAAALAPVSLFAMGISARVTTIVAITMVALGVLANTIGSALPFVITWVGQDPAIIVGPLMTTSVDTLGLLTYLAIATLYLR